MKKQIGLILLAAGTLCIVFLLGLFVGRCSEKSKYADPIQATRSNSTTYRETRININTADSATLQTLPGIGKILADRIVEYRTKNGPFTSVYDLQNVDGIGSKKVNDILELIYVEDIS